MSRRSPLVSIGLPVYNGGKYLRGTLASLLAQDYTNFELILSDNGSTDNTEDICREYAERDARIQYVRQKENLGGERNFCFVLEPAQGEYFMWACHDDEWSPNYISSLLAHLERDPDTALAFSNNYFVNDDGDVVIDCGQLGQLAEDLPIVQRMHHILWFEEGAQKGNAMWGLMRTETVKKIGPSYVGTEGFGDFGFDQLFLFKLGLEGKFVFEPEATFYKRYFPERAYDADNLLDNLHEIQGYFARYRQIVQQSDLDKMSKDVLSSSVAAREAMWSWRILNATNSSDFQTNLKGILEYCDRPETQRHTLHPERHLEDTLTSIILFNDNGMKHIQQCIESVRRHATTRHEIVVFDNASTDGSRAFLRSVPDVTLIESPVRVGRQAAHAQALCCVSGEYIVALDADTIVTAQWLARLLDHLRLHPKVGILGPRSNRSPGPQVLKDASYSSAFQLGQFAKLRTLKWHLVDRELLAHADRVSGSCMLMRRQVVERIGGPDSQLDALNLGEIDYALRANIAGYRTMIANDVYVHHAGELAVPDPVEARTVHEQAWRRFKTKWNLPAELEYGAAYEIDLSRRNDPTKYFIHIAEEASVAPHIYQGRPSEKEADTRVSR